VSELFVLVFQDEYRAPEVLNELRRRKWDWADGLDDAVALTLDQKGKAKVQMSVDLSTTEAVRWAKMWGALLGATLFIPLSDVRMEAAARVALAPGILKDATPDSDVTSPDARWWQKCIHLPDEFLRDVAAAIQPGDSAIFMLLQTSDPQTVLKHLRNYGGTILHTSLGPEQDEKIRIRLSL
jgi:uncharacterized membrane protein